MESVEQPNNVASSNRQDFVKIDLGKPMLQTMPGHPLTREWMGGSRQRGVGVEE